MGSHFATVFVKTLITFLSVNIQKNLLENLYLLLFYKSASDENARQLVRGALGTLDARSSRAASPLAGRARPPLRKAVFHLAWSPDTLPTSQVRI